MDEQRKKRFEHVKSVLQKYGAVLRENSDWIFFEKHPDGLPGFWASDGHVDLTEDLSGKLKIGTSGSTWTLAEAKDYLLQLELAIKIAEEANQEVI